MMDARTKGAFRWIGGRDTHLASGVPLILTVPHSGETVPPEASWLSNIPREVLLTDIDRYVDGLYEPAATSLQLPLLATDIHRYCVDLNRYPSDVDSSSVAGATSSAGTFPQGFHWRVTTLGHELIRTPIAARLHASLVVAYHDRFHAEIEGKLSVLRSQYPGRTIYHYDCHSMPSTGTDAHKDAGRRRPEVCLSDYNGKSASPEFFALTRAAFVQAGFQVELNWPYQGGRITQRYGQPSQKMETVQIELNRSLYMDEQSREKLPCFHDVSSRLKSALEHVVKTLASTDQR